MEVKTMAEKLKVGDYIYVSYWNMVDRVKEIRTGVPIWGTEYVVEQITPVNSADIDRIGRIRTHSTKIGRGDKIVNMNEVAEFVDKHEFKEAILTKFPELRRKI